MQRLTDAMRRDWTEKGYIHLKGVLPDRQIAGYLAATDEVIARYREDHPEARERRVAPRVRHCWRRLFSPAA